MNNSFTVLPMSQRFSLEPGKTYSGSISIVNPADSTEDFHYKVEILPYSVMGEEYEADLVTVTNRSEIVKWISVPEKKGSVKPNETKKVEFTITVPENAAGGGQYGAIAVSSDDSSDTDNGLAIKNVFELASLIYGNVAGETTRGGSVLENNIPGFSVSSPVTVSALISNEGNIHEDASFVIKVTNFFTGEVILPTDKNDGHYSELIMPESTRYVLREIDNLPMLGAINVSQSIYYRGELSEAEQTIIICPIWFMALVLLTVFAIIATIVNIVMRHKRKHKVI